MSRHLGFLDFTEIHEQLHRGVVTGAHEAVAMPEMIEPTVTNIQPVGMR